MVRTKAVSAPSPGSATRQSRRKRTRDESEEPEEAQAATPSKRRGRPSLKARENALVVPSPSHSASKNSVKQTNGTLETEAHEDQPNGATPTSRRSRKAAETADTTPSRPAKDANGETPRWRRNDRSARKKSARALIERVVTGNESDEDEIERDITREIYESSDDEEDGEQQEGLNGEDEDLDLDEVEERTEVTPSKKRRGRPPKSDAAKSRKKSPTPPRDLPPHELYFAQNRTGASKTSNNNLASLELLTHEEYFTILHDQKDRHAEDIEFLQSLHAESFAQWTFELSQGYNICLYGYGSKRHLLQNFAKHVYNEVSDHSANPIVIINGYVKTTSVREILGTVASSMDPSHKLPAGNPSAMLDEVKSLLSSYNVNLTLVLNSIDALPLRRSGFQSILAQLASHPQIRLICSADTPDFSLLWDSGLRSSFNFAFHDCTTFAPYTAEIDVVDEVHELLGRKARRVGGKEGVTYVLRSLPENAKNLFRLLVGEVLTAMDDEGTTVSGENPGIEYRILYNKAVEEFICSSEMAFRTLLKEFHDHQMITSRKDVLGTELLSLPFRKEELESILEDLMS